MNNIKSAVESFKLGPSFEVNTIKLDEIKKMLDSDSDKDKMDSMKRLIAVRNFAPHLTSRTHPFPPTVVLVVVCTAYFHSLRHLYTRTLIHLHVYR